jgi:putative membrane protein
LGASPTRIAKASGQLALARARTLSRSESTFARSAKMLNPVSKSLLFLALAGVSPAALADTSSPPSPTTFVKKAALTGMTEVELGKIALSKSQDPEVRSFAQRMVTDHGKANAELSSIAKTEGIDAPRSLDAEHRAMVDELKGKEGADFDRSYSHHMNMGHSEAIELFESAAGSSDASLAGFAKKTLPTLKEHKKLAEKLPGP